MVIGTYTLVQLQGAVRALIQNIPANVYPDDKLNVALRIGKRRLDYDRPNIVTSTINGSGSSYYQLTATVTDWINDQSSIRQVIYPVPDQSSNEPPLYLDYKQVKLTRIGSNDYLFAPDVWANGKQAMVEFTTPWSVAGLEDAITTTLTLPYQSALELICASRVCTSLAAKAAGTLDDLVPADQINYRSMEQEYGRAAQNFLDLYNDMLNIDTTGAKAIMKRADYDDARTIRFITHRTVLGQR